MTRVASATTKPISMDRATKRAVGKQVNAAIHQLQLADECVHDQEPAKARHHLKMAREAIEEGVSLLKGL